MIMKRPRAAHEPKYSAAPYPRTGTWTTRAPHCSAISIEPSDEPLSATSTSPLQRFTRSQDLAFSIHVPSVSASFKHGIRIETSHAIAVAAAEPARPEARPSVVPAALFVRLFTFQPSGCRVGRLDASS